MSEEMQEEWRPVVGWEGLYEVSSLGRIRSLDRIVLAKNNRARRVDGRILADAQKGRGYRGLTLKGHPKPFSCYTHRVAAEAFIGPLVGGLEVNHKDGDKANNRISNLELCTKTENLRHSYRVLGNKSCERHPMAKLTNEDARSIVRLVRDGLSRTKAAALFGVSRTIADNIMKGWIWSDATGIPRRERDASSPAQPQPSLP